MKFGLLLFAVLTLLGLAGCSSTEKNLADQQVEDALRKNPDILFKVIEDNPEKFVASVNKAVRAAQQSQGADREKMMEARMQADLKNPKKPIYEDSRILSGPKDASIVVVEYGDFQCPACAVGAKNFNVFKDKYKDQVKFVFKHMPLDFHAQAMNAAIAYELIRKDSKEKAYTFYLEAYQKPGHLDSEAELEKILKMLGYSWKTLKNSKGLSEAKKIIEADMDEFKKFGYTGTPVFILNGLSLEGAQPTQAFEKAVDLTRKN